MCGVGNRDQGSHTHTTHADDKKREVSLSLTPGGQEQEAEEEAVELPGRVKRQISEFDELTAKNLRGDTAPVAPAGLPSEFRLDFLNRRLRFRAFFHKKATPIFHFR